MIGAVLNQAGLLTPGQIQVVLTEQEIYAHLRFGEIIALHGWVKQETIDFFVEEWKSLQVAKPSQPIGYYFQRANLLTDEQIKEILKEQWSTSYRFGSIAVLKGWLKQDTVDFFVHHLSPQASKESLRIERSKESLSLDKRTMTGGKKTLEQKYQDTYIQRTYVPAATSHSVIDPEDLADIKDFEVDWKG